MFGMRFPPAPVHQAPSHVLQTSLWTSVGNIVPSARTLVSCAFGAYHQGNVPLTQTLIVSRSHSQRPSQTWRLFRWITVNHTDNQTTLAFILFRRLSKNSPSSRHAIMGWLFRPILDFLILSVQYTHPTQTVCCARIFFAQATMVLSTLHTRIMTALWSFSRLWMVMVGILCALYRLGATWIL